MYEFDCPISFLVPFSLPESAKKSAFVPEGRPWGYVQIVCELQKVSSGMIIQKQIESDSCEDGAIYRFSRSQFYAGLEENGSFVRSRFCGHR